MDTASIKSTDQAVQEMALLLASIHGTETFIDENVSNPYKRQKLQSEIGKKQERIAEIEREWPEAAQKLDDLR